MTAPSRATPGDARDCDPACRQGDALSAAGAAAMERSMIGAGSGPGPVGTSTAQAPSSTSAPRTAT